MDKKGNIVLFKIKATGGASMQPEDGHHDSTMLSWYIPTIYDFEYDAAGRTSDDGSAA